MVGKIYGWYLGALSAACIGLMPLVDFNDDDRVFNYLYLACAGLLILSIVAGILFWLVNLVEDRARAKALALGVKNKEEFHISFYDDAGLLHTEYIPVSTKSYEYFIHRMIFKIRIRLNKEHYYWQARHYLTPRDRKVEDIRFLIHCYLEHDMEPKNPKEAKHLRHAYQLYMLEFEKLIAPKLELEKENQGISSTYARAYYKMWLKKPDVEMKEFYHGVATYDYLKMFDKLINIETKSFNNFKQKIYYHNRKAKK